MSGMTTPVLFPVGAAVSAKYKGAYCSAEVKGVSKKVKVTVRFLDGPQQRHEVWNEFIQGNLETGAVVQALTPKGSQYAPAEIVKLVDKSLYTVVFDDGDVSQLKRGKILPKGEKHFSVSLDQFPMLNPERFSSPVVPPKFAGSRRAKARAVGSTNGAESSPSTSAEGLAINMPNKMTSSMSTLNNGYLKRKCVSTSFKSKRTKSKRVAGTASKNRSTVPKSVRTQSSTGVLKMELVKCEASSGQGPLSRSHMASSQVVVGSRKRKMKKPIKKILSNTATIPRLQIICGDPDSVLKAIWNSMNVSDGKSISEPEVITLSSDEEEEANSKASTPSANCQAQITDQEEGSGQKSTDCSKLQNGTIRNTQILHHGSRMALRSNDKSQVNKKPDIELNEGQKLKLASKMLNNIANESDIPLVDSTQPLPTGKKFNFIPDLRKTTDSAERISIIKSSLKSLMLQYIKTTQEKEALEKETYKVEK